MEAQDFDLKKVLPVLLETVRARGTDWERSFVKSVCEQYARRDLSYKQTAIVKRIARKYDPVAMKQNRDFQESFDAGKREDLIYVAKVRKQQNKLNASRYFESMINDVLTNPDFVPTKSQWDAFMENKYSKGYLRAKKSKAKFKKGELVKHRAGAGNIVRRQFEIGIVHDIEHELPDTYARGAKKYLIIPIGGTKMYTREERDLVKCRNP